MIQVIGKGAYKLALPPSLKVHNVFNIAVLKPYLSDGSIQPPQPVYSEGEAAWVAEAIVDHRERRYGKGVRREYLVQWQGRSPEHNSWEAEKSVASLPIFPEYWASCGFEPPVAVPEPGDGVEDDTPCEVCGSVAAEPPMLLCDKCDKGYHISCLTPPLTLIPRGRWFCPGCKR